MHQHTSSSHPVAHGIQPRSARPAREIAFIDTALDDRAILAAALRPGVTAVEFGGAQDGLAQLGLWAHGQTGHDAIHVLCHGEPGRLILGGRVLDLAGLDTPEGAAALAALGAALKPGGALLLYGCSVGAGAAGEGFVAALARATGATVAASAAPTGAAARGGDWALPVRTGDVHVALALEAETAAAWPHLMAGVTFDLSAGTRDDNTDFAGAVTETIGGLTMSATANPIPGFQDNDAYIWDTTIFGDFSAPTWSYVGTSNNSVVVVGQQGLAATVTVTFNQAIQLDSLDFADAFNSVGMTLRITATNTSDTTVVNVPATGDTRVALHWAGVTGFTISNEFGQVLDPFIMDNIAVTPGSPPATTVAGAALSADTGASSTDFVTKTAAQTISGTLSAQLASGETVQVSYDGGAHWQNADVYSAGSNAWSASTTLTGSGTLVVRVANVYGNGTGYSHAYTVDATAPNAPSAPDLGSGSDSGASSSDDITANTTPTIAGTAESGSTVTLYDTDGTTVLGTTTATGGSWSISSSALGQGSHTVTAKATDLAGNVSAVSAGLSVTIDTAAPASVALSASSLVTANAGSGAAVGTLSATDATAVTYALATGNGTNDADNGQFAVSGNTLSVGGSALTAGTYHVYLSATDAAGNVSYLAQNITVQSVPAVSSIMRAGGAGAGVAGAATSVDYTVTFSESVTGVDASDFALTATGTASGTVASVSGSGTTYTVTVDTLAGDGTLRLDLNASGTGIQNAGSVAIGGGYTAGASYTLDHTAPNAPSTPDLSSVSDSGGSSSDDITASATPVVTGTAESGSTVTLYDTDGTTVLGTTTATGGNWSITASTLGQGSHTLTAKAADSAGNVSNASSSLAVTIDTAAPASVALSASSLVTANAGTGATVGTLSATDATAVTYALATGNGTNDADNASFVLSGNTLSIGGLALTAGTYHVYLSATDAAGNVTYLAQNITVQDAPTVSSIVRVGAADAGAATSVDYTVTFSESVTGVDASDFALTATGTASGTVASVSGSGTTYTVTVDTLAGDGTLRLDLNASGTGIQNAGSVAIGGGYTAGASYTLDHTAPNAPSTPDLSSVSDSGGSSSDDITASATPVVTGTAESGSTVTLYDTDGTTVLGTTTATGGNWSITASTLGQGSHTLTAKAADSAGNVSNASSSLAVTIDTAAPASVGLSASTLVTSGAGSGATVGTLSATDTTAVTYALATGNGTIDADNASFALSGNTLSIGSSALTAGTYHVYLSATDAAGNVTYLAQNITVQDAPTVSSIVRVGAADAGAATSVDYTVTFSESVTGVDASDFALTATGTAAGHIAAVNGSGTTYTITVDSLAGDGTLRLDLKASGTGIQNAGSVAIGGGYTAGASYTLDHTAPNAPSTPDLSSVSDSGGSSSDDITASATPVITGTAESGSTVTLYDTDGTTVLGTTTATNGAWSITASTLAEGSHTLTAKAADSAGNVSNASSSLAVTIDTTAPASVGLSASTLVTSSAGSGATVGTLSATDATAVTYALATGNGTNDADNASFALSGNTLSIGGSALTAGTYLVYLSATDAAGNVTYLAQNITVQDAPTVSSIVRVGGADAGAATSVDYTVTFSESVTGVDASDFALTATGTAAGHIAAVNGSGTTYTITVDSLAGDGTLRLDLKASGTGIQNAGSVAIGGGYTAGASYTLDHTAPNAPSTPDLSSVSDSGGSSSDDITASATPVITGTAESGSTVTLYDTDGTTVLGTTTATNGAWSITASTLAEGSHTLTAKAADAAGNVSTASSPLAVTIDTAAPASVALSASSLVTANAGTGATVGTLSATDATSVTYALAAGNGSNDADNGQFALSGNTLIVGGSALTAGTYHVYLSATDAAGNVTYLAQNITVQDAPTVSSIVRVGGADAGAATSVDYTVTFSESVTGVDASDFALTATGTAAGHIAAVNGSGTTYTITVDSLAGDGTLRLDLKASGTGIQNAGSVAIGGGYTAGASYTLDHTAPNAPSTPDLSSVSDSGGSSSDDFTASATPVITGTAESGSTVTLYDTDGTTVLGTTTATGGNWSITASTLGQGSHTLTAKAADAAGNVSTASSSLAVTVDTAAPASVGLSASSLVTSSAGSGATVGTLSATDATAVTYALATGNGSNDADNGQFALSGNTLTVGGTALTAGTYHVYLSATDAAGNVSHIAQTVTVQDVPSVSSIVRVGGADAGAATSVDYTVTFSESVTGVDASDFALTATGTAAGHIAAVNGSGTTYTITVDSLAGDGTLRLDLKASGTGIQNAGSVAIGGGYTAGASYTLDHTAPNAPSTPDLSSVSDSGGSSSDDITASATPVITGTAESGSTVTLYDTDGTTVLGTTTATNGTWSITASTLAEGSHTLTAKATDAAGNVSNQSVPLVVKIDTAAAAAPGAIALAAASDSGIVGDGITNVDAPAITGSAEANATVTLYDTDGTTQLGTTTADGNGAWQIVSAALADGIHTLTARQVDLAGNASAASAGLAVTIDTQAPAAPGAPVLDAASDSGASGDGITTVTRPVIRGTGAANAVVTLYDTDGTTQLGTATADGAGAWSVTSAALSVGTHTLTAKQVDAAGNVSAAGAALALTIAAPPAPPPPASSTIDGVVVSAQPVVLPDGASGTQTVVPIVTPSRVEQTGAAAVADIPLVQSGGANLLLAQVPVGFGLSATGGASRPAGDSVEHLIQAIVAATPDHVAGDQAHLTGNGKQFLQALAADAPLLVQTIVPVSTDTAPAGQLVLTGTSSGAQHTALVIDATQLAAGSGIALNGVDFAAIVGAANVTGNSAGQILTGDAAAQTFTVTGNLGGAVFAGGGGDRLAFAATPATPSSADGGARAAAGPVQTILHGGLGTDTAVFDGARAAYTIEQHEGYLVVTPSAQPAQHAVVINVESLQFADATETVANRAGLSSIAGLYQAILGRQADYLGMDFWGNADKNGVGLGEVALRMIASQEGQARLAGTFDGNAAHDVALLYQDLFGRAGEAAGLAFWTDAMAHGATLAQVAQGFATSAEFEQHKVGVAQWDFLV